jgi:hypothetical protein
VKDNLNLESVQWFVDDEWQETDLAYDEKNATGSFTHTFENSSSVKAEVYDDARWSNSIEWRVIINDDDAADPDEDGLPNWKEDIAGTERCCYDTAEKKFVTYTPLSEGAPIDVPVEGGKGYIAMMKAPARVTFEGVAWDGSVSLTPGMNLISVPLEPSAPWTLSDMFNFIGTDVSMIICYNTEKKRFDMYLPTHEVILCLKI